MTSMLVHRVPKSIKFQLLIMIPCLIESKFFIVWLSFPSLPPHFLAVFPGISSQINYLNLNRYLRVRAPETIYFFYHCIIHT